MGTRSGFAGMPVFLSCVLFFAVAVAAGENVSANGEELLARGSALIESGAFPDEVHQGVALVKSAAEQGYAPAREALPEKLYMAGNRYLKEKEPDIGKARLLFLESAELGFSPGQAMMGMFHYTDRFGMLDLPQAKEWLKKGAENGHPIAQGLYGSALMQESHDPIDSFKYMVGLRWIHLAADQGYEDAIKALDALNGVRLKGAKQWTSEQLAAHDERVRKAEQGDVEEQYRLGVHYFSLENVVLDFEKAIHWFEKAGENGHLQSQINMAEMYAYIPGFQNPEKRFYWVEKAAAQNDPVSMAQLGAMYALGEGIKQDLEKGTEYLFKALELGSPKAMLTLDGVYGMASDHPEDAAARFSWLRRGAEREVPNAQFHLGLALALGNGCTEDLVASAQWLHKAADHGIPEAQKVLGDFYHDGVGVKRDLYKAREFYMKAHAAGIEEAPQSLIDKIDEEIREQEGGGK